MVRGDYMKHVLPHLITAISTFIVAFVSLQGSREAVSVDMVKTLYDRVGQLERKIFEQTAEISRLNISLSEVQESETILLSFLDAMPYPAWIKTVSFDDDVKPIFKMWFINDKYSETYNVSQSRYENRTDFEVWPHESAQGFYDNDVKVLDSMDSRCEYETFEEDALNGGKKQTQYVCKWVTQYNGKLAIAGQVFTKEG